MFPKTMQEKNLQILQAIDLSIVMEQRMKKRRYKYPPPQRLKLPLTGILKTRSNSERNGAKSLLIGTSLLALADMLDDRVEYLVSPGMILTRKLRSGEPWCGGL